MSAYVGAPEQPFLRESVADGFQLHTDIRKFTDFHYLQILGLCREKIRRDRTPLSRSWDATAAVPSQKGLALFNGHL